MASIGVLFFVFVLLAANLPHLSLPFQTTAAPPAPSQPARPEIADARLSSPASAAPTPPPADSDRAPAMAAAPKGSAPATPLTLVKADNVVPAPDPVPLKPYEIMEVQYRLRDFGFYTGPLDGNAGPMTAAAVAHYQKARGLAPTGSVDRDVLTALRQDPTPPSRTRTPSRTYTSSRTRTPMSDFFDSLNGMFRRL